MLDDGRVIKQRDSQDALGIVASQWRQAKYDTGVLHGDNDGREIKKIVIAGMGGSALAGLIIKHWLEPEITLPIEIVRTYQLPNYVDSQTLVICSSYSGNTEETLACLEDALGRGAQIGITTAGGELKKLADKHDIAITMLPAGLQPRMAVIYNLRTTLKLLVHFGVVDVKFYNEIEQMAEWLHRQSEEWVAEVSAGTNAAKQLALLSVGKTAVFYASNIFAPLAYKWKISWNETSKNMAFCNEMPEFNHNEFMGWSSHPVDKPFVVFDLMSNFDHPQIKKRFILSDRLLSGRRPKAHVINLQGESVISQMLWGSILADFASVYTAILNGVDPSPVHLIEKLKKQL